MKLTMTLSKFVLLILFVHQGFVSAQIIWQKHPSNPVIPSWGGGIDDPSGYKYTIGPSILYNSEKKLYQAWFTSLAFGYGTSFCISNAISFDGIEWYTYFKNPVLSPTTGTFDQRNIFRANVIQDNNGYKMFFTGYDDRNNRFNIGLAISQDGLNWEKYKNNPVLTGSDEPNSWEKDVLYPYVVFDGTKYWMWYGGSDGLKSRMGLATSEDGFNWVKSSANPVLDTGPPGSWDEFSAATPAVCKVDNLWYMFYLGFGSYPLNKVSIGFCVSRDGIVWQKYSGNPVLIPGKYGLWDDLNLGMGTVLFHDKKFHFWYSGQNSYYRNWQIGYAVSEYTPLSAGDFIPLPLSFTVYPSFPNPFNSNTQIKYDIPEKGTLTIKIFDILGKEVKVLYNGETTPGQHSVVWDGKNSSGMNVTSDVYFSRIEYITLDGNKYVDVKKITLIR